jgi:metal-responsive CopG/Arc/MetJ family transcriptional regulator
MSAAEVRTTVLLPADLAEAVDNYWHTQRLNTRPDAIRELLAYALDRKAADKPAKEKTR